MKLYHGSSKAIEKPDVTFNKGFSDLGQGFYVTDDYHVAASRARARARIDNADHGMVTVFEFDESAPSWITLGNDGPIAQANSAEDARREASSQPSEPPIENHPLSIRFAETQEGLVAWANYIKACRRGITEIDGIGDPSIVRAWIANEDIEMVCSGFAPAEALAEFIKPADLIVQYCFRTQEILDKTLTFVSANRIEA